MAASDQPAQRVRAARMLGASARYQSIRLLLSLAADADPEVKKYVYGESTALIGRKFTEFPAGSPGLEPREECGLSKFF